MNLFSEIFPLILQTIVIAQYVVVSRKARDACTCTVIIYVIFESLLVICTTFGDAIHVAVHNRLPDWLRRCLLFEASFATRNNARTGNDLQM